MLEKLKDILTNPTVRRLVVAGIAAAVVAANKKWSLGLDPQEVAGLVLLALGYLIQSAMVDRARILAAAQQAGNEAAAKVETLDAAAAELAKKGPTP